MLMIIIIQALGYKEAQNWEKASHWPGKQPLIIENPVVARV